MEIRVSPDSPAIGKRLADLDLPTGFLVITISREGDFVIPSGQTEVRENDALLVLADMHEARAIEALLDARRPRPETNPG